MTEDFRWNPYVLLKNSHLDSFLSEYLNHKERKIAFILGKGFDVRMNLGINSLHNKAPKAEIQVDLIEYNEDHETSLTNKHLESDSNYNELLNNIGEKRIKQKTIKLWAGKGSRMKRVGDREVAQLYKTESFEGFTDIIVDISAMPRSIYFSLIGKILSIIDKWPSTDSKPNLFVLTAENAALDAKIMDQGIQDDLRHPFGFSGGQELAGSNQEKIWLPIMGEGKSHHIDKANQFINPIEICPVLPFPSKNPRRSDNIIASDIEAFVNILRIEPQNMLYVPEQNPFEAYRQILNEIIKYNDALKSLGGCKAVVSCFSSKLLSLGALLASYEMKTKGTYNVGILNVDAQGYTIKDNVSPEDLRDESELFLLWLSGEAYEN